MMIGKKISPIIFSRDCNGFQYYKKYNLQYNSPTIGNCLRVPDFITFLKFLEYTYYFNINKKDVFKNILPSFENENIGIVNYPIGNISLSLHGELRNIKVHFQHDFNRSDIIDKWNRRMLRFTNDLQFNMNNVLFFLNDIDLKECTEPFHIYIKEFLNITIGNKILFCKQKTFNEISKKLTSDLLKKGHIIIIPDYCDDGIKIYNYIDKTKILDKLLNIAAEKISKDHTVTIIGKYFVHFL
jgi:uncharacterized protein (DUF1919 family)